MIILASPRTFRMFTGSPNRDATYTFDVSANKLAQRVAAE
jgi:hypothetical protein